MSVKTEAIKPAAEISLFDAFGPNVSEQVQAINQKAAELSMDDMARVMGVKITAKKRPEIAAASEDRDETHDLLNRWVIGCEHEPRVFLHTSSKLAKAYTMPPSDFRQMLPVAETLVRQYSPVLIGLQGIQEVIGAVPSKFYHLQSVGSDESTFKVFIHYYKDPRTGAFCHETLEADSAISLSPFDRHKFRNKKNRRSGHEIMMHTLTAKK